MTWRAAWRGVLLGLALLVCLLRFGWLWLGCVLRRRPVASVERAQWMTFCGRLVLAALGIRYRIEGEPPVGVTVIAANHLSYLDIAIAAASLPCAFVARHDVGEWPVFGPLSRMGGTIYVDRESRWSAWKTADLIAQRLAEGVPVFFFPEGTSTDGREVLRFHSTLFAPAVERGLKVTPAAILYETHGAAATERDLCWFGDDAFAPHLLQVLGVTGFTAVVRFGAPELHPDRKAGAYRSHDSVAALRRVSC